MISSDYHRLKIVVCGDYYPYQEISDYVNKNKSGDVSELFGDIKPLIDSADFSMINIEFPLTESNTPIKKAGPCLKGDPITILPVAKAGFDLLCMSNNHTLDFGINGMLDTIELASQHSIKYVGCGMTIEEARKPYVIQKNGISLAILNFSENEFNVATINSGGANPLNEQENIHDIKKAKQIHGNVLVIVHGGQDFCLYPPPHMIRRFRRFAEEGATAIVCHHSHYISGYEVYQNVPIFYGIGNVIYPKFVDAERNKTIAIELDFYEHSINHKQHRFIFDRVSFQLKHPKALGDDFEFQVNEISKIIPDMNLLVPSWMQGLKVNGERDRYLWILMGYPHCIYKIFKKMRWLRLVSIIAAFRSRHLQLILNLIRRETHRDAIICILEEMEKHDKDN